jgi:peroxin-10
MRQLNPSIVRAHQRDLIQVSSFREHTEDVLRSWIGQCSYTIMIVVIIIPNTGTRRLARWLPELDLFVKLAYYGLTTGLGTTILS